MDFAIVGLILFNPKKMRIIDENISLSDLVAVCPDSLIILENAGLKVKECNVDMNKSLKNFFEYHTLDEEKTSKVLLHLNKLRQVDFDELPSDEDFLLIEVVRDGKKYQKIAGLYFTEVALDNLKAVATAGGLRINLITGGCSGFKYHFDFYDEPLEGERIYGLSDSLDLYLDDFTFARSKGAIVDFKLGLHESGLKIVNPNQQHGCSCGKSISF